MRCPMIMVDRTWGIEEGGKESDRCIQEECAWWDTNGNRCAVLELSKLLNAIGNTLGKIDSKIPLGILR